MTFGTAGGILVAEGSEIKKKKHINDAVFTKLNAQKKIGIP